MLEPLDSIKSKLLVSIALMNSGMPPGAAQIILFIKHISADQYVFYCRTGNVSRRKHTRCDCLSGVAMLTSASGDSDSTLYIVEQ